MAKRKGLSKRTRFEVFKRDSFTCQYCGAKAPDVVLNVDHIKPVADGGDNEIINLVTACDKCNSGKSDKKLSDNSAIERQREQLADLQARREQLEMMLEWREGLRGIKSQAEDAAARHWTELTGFTLTEVGRKGLKKLIREYGMSAVINAMDAAEDYIEIDQAGKATHVSAENAFKKISGILYCEKNPHVRDRSYIKGILRNRLRYWVEYEATAILDDAFAKGIPFNELKSIAIRCTSWSSWREMMDDGLRPSDGDSVQ